MRSRSSWRTSSILRSKSNPARVINNADWLLSLPLVDFLRDIGKHFTVNYMIAKDSVRNRIEREEGISFTEFSYMLLQSYDFLHLYDTEGCKLQTGGSDQWGNITAGVELIRSMRGEPGLRHGLPADHQGGRHQVRQDRIGLRLAGRRTALRPTASTSSG